QALTTSYPHRHGSSVRGSRPRCWGVSAKPFRAFFQPRPRMRDAPFDGTHQTDFFRRPVFLPTRFGPQGRSVMKARYRLPTSLLLLNAGPLGAALFADEPKSAFPESVGSSSVSETGASEAAQAADFPPRTAMGPESTSALAGALTVTLAASPKLPQAYGTKLTYTTTATGRAL